MKQLSRREFCSITAALGATALSAPHSLMAQPAALQVSLAIDPSTSLANVPVDFMGLSYESGQLAYPDYFSSQNTALIEIFRRLSPAGVLRLGGNLSEFTVWSESEPATPPEAGGLVGPDPGHREPRTFTITPLSIRNLQGFLNATGWRCIYGLNLGGGTPEQALAEGSFVAKTLGPQLMCVQFGNEPDLFKHRDQGNKPWTYNEFLARWKMFRAAFHEKLPEVAVAGPDTASNQKWVKQFTEDVPKEIVLVTSHYYPEGPPADPRMNIDQASGSTTPAARRWTRPRPPACHFAWRKEIPATTQESRGSAIRLHPRCGRGTSACKWRPWAAWESTCMGEQTASIRQSWARSEADLKCDRSSTD
jgi:hypothetical protein